MPTQLSLKALVDFVLQPGKIDDTQLVRQIQQTLAKTKIPKLSVTPVFNIDDKAFQNAFKKKGVLTQLDAQLDAIEKRMDSFGDKVNAQAKASAEKMGIALGGGSKEGAAAQQRVQHLISQGVAELATQREILGLAKTSEQALQRFYKTGAGQKLPETLDVIKKLQSGQIVRGDLNAATVKAVRDTTAFLEQRADHLAAIDRAAGKLTKQVQGPLAADAETGAAGRPLIEGVPIHLPELRNQVKDLRNASRDVNTALEDQKVKRYQTSLEGLKAKLKEASTGFGQFTRAVKKQEGMPFVDQLKSDMAKVRGEIDGIRSSFKEAQKIKEFGPRSEAINRLYSELEKKERGIAKVRENLGREVSQQRELELGRYLKNFREIERSTTAQQQAIEGRRLLAGAPVPEAAIGRIADPLQGRNVMAALQEQILSTTDKMAKLSSAARTAGTSVGAEFTTLNQQLLQQERLFTDAAERTRDLTQARTATGRQEATEQGRRTDVMSRAQVGVLQDANTQLEGLAKNLSSSKLGQTDLSKATAQVDALNRRAADLRTTLSAVTGLEDIGERGRLTRGVKDEIGLLDREVKRFVKSTNKQISTVGAGFEKAFSAERLAAGNAVLERLGPRLDFAQLNDVADLSNAVDALREKQRLATEQAKTFANTVSDGSQENKDRLAELQRVAAGYGTQVADATARLKQVSTSETQKGIADLGKQITTFGDQADKSLNSTNKSLTGFSKSLSGMVDDDDFGALNDQAKRLDDRLKALRAQRHSLVGGTTQEDLERTEGFLKDVQRLQADVEAARQIPTERARQASLAEAATLREGIEAEQRERDQVRTGRDELARLQREVRVPGQPLQGIPPLVLAAQMAPIEQQQAVMAALQDQSRRLEASETARLERAAHLGEAELRRAQDKLALQKQTNAEAKQALRDRGEVTFPEERIPTQRLTDAQVSAAKQAYGIDLRELETRQRGMADLARSFEAEVTGIERKRAEIVKKIGASAARADKEFTDLGKRLPIVQRDLGLVRKETESFNKAAASITQLTTPEEIQKVLAARALEGRRIVDQAGGEAALAKSLRGIAPEDRARLPLVRETLQQQLGSTLAQMDRLTSKSGGRTTEEFRKSQVEATNLRKAITRVNTELQGYTKLTAQVGGLFRQFARYGIGYAALYQGLAAIRGLITGVTDLDSALVSIQAVTQTTDKQMQIIEGSIKRVAVQTKFTTGAIAEAGQVLAQAGVLPRDFPEALSATAQFAAATESSMQISADLLSTMRNVFTELSDLDIANQLTRAVNISKLTAADLKTILSLSGQVAQGYNLSSEQYLAAVTTLRNAGIKASTVATGLRQALIEVFAPDSKSLKILSSRYAQLGEARAPEEISQRFFQFSQAPDPALAVLRELRRLGFTSTGKATFAGRTFDVRAENVIKGLINRLSEFSAAQSQIAFGNAAVAASQQQMEALNASMSNLGAAISATAHSLSQDLLPSIESLIDGATDAVQKLGTFDSELRSQAGTSAFSTLFSGGLSLALAAKTTPTNLGFGRAAVRNTAAFGVGTFAAGQAQKIAGDKGFGSDAAALIGDLTALLTTFVFFMGPQLKKFGGLIKSKGKGLLAATAGATLVGNAVNSISKFFSSVGSVLGKIPLLGRAFSLSGIGSIVALTLGAFALIKRYTGTSEFADAQSKLKQAERSALSSSAIQRELSEYLETLRPTGDGFVAGSDSISGQTEQLNRDLLDLRVGITRFFGVSGDEAEKVLDLLRELERTGFAEGSPVRNALVAQIEELTGVDLTTSGFARDELNRLQDALAKVDNQSSGLLKNARENYDKFVERREELSGTVEGAFYESLERAAEAEGLTAELNGVLEASSDSIGKLFASWIKNFGDAKATIDEVREANEKAKRDEGLRQAAFVASISAARSVEEAERLVREGTTVPVTQEQVTQRQADISGLEGRAGPLREQVSGQSRAAVLARQGFSVPEITPLLEELKRLEAVIQILNEKISASVAASERVLDARRAEVKSELDTFVALQEVAPTNRKVASELEQRAESPITAEAFDDLKGILALTGGDTSRAAEVIVAAEREAGELTTIVEDPTTSKLLKGLSDVFVNFEKNRGKEDTRPLTYLETEEARLRTKQLGLLELEIKKLERSQRFGDLDGLLADRKRTLIDQIQGEIAFEGRKDPPATKREGVSRQKKLDDLNLRLLNAEFQYENDVNEAHRKEIAIRERQLNQHLKRLKVLSESSVSTGGFSDFEGLKGLEDQYRDSLAKLIEVVRERAAVQNLSADDTRVLLDAVRDGATSLRAFAEIYGKIVVESQRYFRALSVVTAPAATTPTTDLDTEIVRRGRGIRPNTQVRLRSLEVQTNAARTELGTRFEVRNRAQEVYETSVREGAAPDVIAQNLDQLAQAEAGVQELIDRTVELRQETIAATLDIGSALRDAFDPDAVFSTFRERAEADIFSLAGDIRNMFGDVFDDVAGDFADALFDSDDEQSLRDRLNDTFNDFFKDLGKRIAEAYFKRAVIGAIGLVAPGALEPDENGNSSPLQKALGLGGKTNGQYETIEIDGKTVIVNGLVAGLPQSGTPGDDSFVGPLRHPGDPKSVNFVGPPRPPVAGGVPVVKEGGEEAEEAATGFFTTIKTGFFKVTSSIGAGLQSLGASIGGLFSKLFGGGDSTGKTVQTVAAIGSTVLAKDGAVLKAGRGAVLKSRRSRHLADGGIIKGPGTETSDSIPGLILDDNGKVQSGLLVSNKEAILNARATAALGEDTINYLNANAKRFAQGGMITAGPSLSSASSSLSRSTRQTATAQPAGGGDMDSLADALISSMEVSEPRKMALEVSDSALNRTLKDYLEGYFADVLAGR
ncbi:MAG: phage tail tape measure protein [Pseudomonadota bacterium]|nr:phage tail tape measure protein [Pseudomonadota bacterium]